MSYSEEFNDQFEGIFNEYINNSIEARKHFNVRINKLIQDYPQIFKHFKYSTGITLIDNSPETAEQAKEILRKYYKQIEPKPQKKFQQLTDIPELKEIIDSNNLSVSNKVSEILNYITSNNLPITLSSTQIKQYIYRTKGKTKKESIYSQPEIDEIIRDEFLTRKEKFRRIKAINDECTFEKMNNYMITKNIKSFKPYKYILDILKQNDIGNTWSKQNEKSLEDLNEISNIIEHDEHLSYLSPTQKKGLFNRFKYGKNKSSESDSDSE